MKQGTLAAWSRAKAAGEPVAAAAAVHGEGDGRADGTADSISIASMDEDDSFGTPSPAPRGELHESRHPTKGKGKKRQGSGQVAEVTIVKRSRADAYSDGEKAKARESGSSRTPRDASKNKAEKASTSGGRANGVSRSMTKNASAYEAQTQPLCHHHRAKCSTPTVRCTAFKRNGDRCVMQYCANSLAKFYGQDREDIIAGGRRDVQRHGLNHVPSSIAEYIWSCPKCLGQCTCSACRKRDTSNYREPLPSTSNLPLSESISARKPLVTKHGARGSPFAEIHAKSRRASGSGHKKQASKGDDCAKDTKEKSAISSTGEGAQPSMLKNFLKAMPILDEGPLTPKASAARESGKAPEAKTKQRALFPQQLSPPKPVGLPQIEPIESRLPVENLLARMWLYETLVRFDMFDVPKAVLRHLDRFDDWNEDHVRVILERLLCFLCEVANIRVAPQGKKHGGILKTYQDAASDVSRGEGWEAVRRLCESQGINVPALQDVEMLPGQLAAAHKVFVQDPADTLLGSRSSRGQRAATTAAIARVKSLSVNELRDDDNNWSEDEEEDRSRLKKRSRAKRILPSDDKGSAGKSGEDAEDDVPSIRSSRRTKSSTTKLREASHSPQRRSLRTQEKRQAEVSEPESGVESEGHDDSSILSHPEDDENGGGQDNDRSVLEEPTMATPVAIPPLEQRVAILCALAELLLRKRTIAEEIVYGVDKVREFEKQLKDEEKELVRQHDEELKAINKKRNDMKRVGKGAQWTEEHDALVKEQAYARIDLRMNIHLSVEAHKPRSGSLGIDVDNNEYWQLTEFNEKMPVDTNRQWSWSLLVLGRGYPRDATKSEHIDEHADGVHPEKREEQSASEDKTPSERQFRGANQVEEISKIIAFVRYRQKVKDYEEVTQELRRDDEVVAEQQRLVEAEAMGAGNNKGGMAGDGINGNGSSSISGSLGASGKARQRERLKAKEDLLVMQDERRTRIDALVQRLTLVKEYYQWHYGEQEMQ